MCVCGTHLCVQTLNSVSAKNMREKHFDRFSSRPRRGTLAVTATLFTGRKKSEGWFVIAKSAEDTGEEEEEEEKMTPWLHVTVFTCPHVRLQPTLNIH